MVARIQSCRLDPASPSTYAIVSTIVRREPALVADLARQVGLLEQRVMAAAGGGGRQEFLTALFTARHELFTIRTVASEGGEIYDGKSPSVVRRTGITTTARRSELSC